MDNQSIKSLTFAPDKLRNLRGSTPRKFVGEQVGVGASQISNYENGIRTPSGTIMLRLLAFYNIRPEQLAASKES